MLIKNPETKMIINKDDSHLTVLKLRRQQKKEAEVMESKFAELQESMVRMREELTIQRQGHNV